MARPTVKTDAILDAIVGHLFAGLSFDTISGLVGVSESAIYKWRKADEDFDARCQEAMRKWEQGKLAVIEEAVYSKDGPKWAMELLRMRFPLKYGDLGTHVATKRLEKEEIDSTLKELSTEDILRELKRRGEERGQ